MIGAAGEAVFREIGGDFLGRFLAGHIDDGGTIDGGQFFQQQGFRSARTAGRDAEIEIRAVETQLHVIGGGNAERLADIAGRPSAWRWR